MTESEQRSTRGRPKTFDRDRAIDVAIDSYWREGPQRMSLNEVCRRADVSKPGVYREFGNEDGLLDAALARYAKQELPPLFDLVASGQPFGEVLDSLVTSMTEPRADRPTGCLLAKTRVAREEMGPLAREQLDQLRQLSVDTYQRWIERAQREGEVDPSIPPELAARFVDAQFNNILGQVAAGEDPEMIRAQAKLAFAGLSGEVRFDAGDREEAGRRQADFGPGL